MGELNLNDRIEALERQLADEYRHAGYDVMVRPKREQAPNWMPFPPDLIAVRGEERIAVEVTDARRAGHADWAAMSAAAEREGWRFRLVVVGADESQTVDYSGPPRSEIERRLSEAEALVADHPEAALLIAWAAFEAAARRSLLTERASLRTVAPVGLIKQLIHHGLVDGAEASNLGRVVQLRNASAHGIGTVRPSESDVSYLIAHARALLRSGT